MINNSLNEIAKEFLKAKTILLYPHVSIDGDALGSSVALLIALRKLNKECYILYDEEIPSNLEFLIRDKEVPYVVSDSNIIDSSNLDISCAIDNGSYQRFESFKDKFDQAKVTICLDHHGTSLGIADFNHIRPECAACGEIIYNFLKELDDLTSENILKDLEIAAALFTAITTDTGNFQFSNTTRESHIIVAELMSWGFLGNPISNEIYENQSLSKIRIENLCLSRMEILADGKIAVSYVTKKELDEYNVKAGETDSIVKTLRSISGVEYSAFVKEKEENVIRVSYRAKTDGSDVAIVAKKHDGGGHKKAAGSTINLPLKEAYEITKKDLLELVK